jgi:hypothetical protein
VRVPDNSALSPAAPVDINELIPGSFIPIYSTLTIRSLQQWQKLDALNVTVEGGEETVSVVISQAPNNPEEPVGDS